jgi:hypothetical protein
MALAARNDAMVCPTRDEKSIFLEAIEIDSAEQRLAFVYAACADNPPLRAGVEALLRAHQKPRPVFNVADASPPPAMDGPGTVIGLYTLIEPIGEGGFGVVYLAEQHAPVRRNVALKVLKPGMGTRQVVARFEAERQALALMDHPNIAKVFDGGATPSGRPYFVNGWICLCTCVTRCSTRTRKGSSTATSSRVTCSSSRTTRPPSPR